MDRPLPTTPRRPSRPGLWTALLGALALAAVLQAPARAQDAPASPPAPPGEQPVEIVLGDEGMTIPEFLRFVTYYTERPIVWSDQDKAVTSKKIQGSLKLAFPPKPRFFDAVRGLLTFQEIVLIPIGPKGYEVYVAMDARTLASQFILKNKPVYMEINDETAREIEQQDGLFVATTIKVKNIDNLRDARTALQRIVTPNNIGNVQEVPAARAFVVTDFAPNVVAIYRLLKEMDVQPQGKEVRQQYFELKHALAEDIEPILQDLFTGKQRVTAPVQGQPGGGDVMDPEARIISDPRTNQILVYATDDDIQEISQVIQQLDKELVWVRQNVHVVRLQNLDAEETAQVLQTLIDGSSLFGSSGGTATTRRTPGRSAGPIQAQPGRVAGSPGSVSPEAQEKPAVVADAASNSLIIAASKEQVADLKAIIEQIDVRKAQVLIEAALLELSLDDSYRFAVELGAVDVAGLHSEDSGPSFFGGTSYGLTEFGDRDGDGLFTDRLPPYILDGGQAPTGWVGGIFAASQVPLIFRALNTMKKTRLLQLPSIVTSDNEEATIRVLEEQATTDSTTSSGGNVSGGFQSFQEAGTTLSISPHIATDNFLLLNINLEVSGFQGEPKTLGTIQIPADRFRRTLITAVVVPDRHTVVIGGLIGSAQTGDVDQVPFLGDLPILGELFKSTAKGERQTNLFLFVTPTIMSAKDANFAAYKRLSCERKQKADELIGENDIPFSNFPGCSSRRCRVDPATGRVLSGSGSASDRLDQAGFYDATSFRPPDPERLRAEAEARRRRMAEGGAPAPSRR